MQFTDEMYAEAMGPMAHQLTVLDTATAVISNGVVKIALVCRIRHADTGDTFDQFMELAPEVSSELVKQLIEMEVVADDKLRERGHRRRRGD